MKPWMRVAESFLLQTKCKRALGEIHQATCGRGKYKTISESGEGRNEHYRTREDMFLLAGSGTDKAKERDGATSAMRRFLMRSRTAQTKRAFDGRKFMWLR